MPVGISMLSRGKTELAIVNAKQTTKESNLVKSMQQEDVVTTPKSYSLIGRRSIGKYFLSHKVCRSN